MEVHLPVLKLSAYPIIGLPMKCIYRKVPAANLYVTMPHSLIGQHANRVDQSDLDKMKEPI